MTAADLKAGIIRLAKRLEQVRAFAPERISEQFGDPEVERIRVSVEEGLQRTFGLGTPDYNRYHAACSFNTGPVLMNRRASTQEVQQALQGAKARSIALLEEALTSLNERLEETGTAGVAAESAPADFDRKVFVVHGHDGEAQQAVARFMERLGFEAIILHERASQGRTVIEKIEAEAGVGFAIVLLTPDDEGRAMGGDLQPRARQNVMLELGYFIGRLGRNRVCALKRGDLEIPSDFAGVVWEQMDDGNGWKQSLGKELEAAGYAVDWNKVMRP
ncbi:TIR domain-containing protein [Sphingomonas sp. Leaf343]|uniref:TIR domain-containing protein n=1 Tax=Sphingomonas sp. Leaf343 TaxID=1736345 RepID=UPI0009E82656|nr:nucleotide-binding protein [Sphingomonas sp. Leaf343]